MLSTTMQGKPFVYLDNAATSLKPQQVIDSITNYYSSYGVNIHRGIYEFSERATREYAEVRTKLAHYLHCPHNFSLIFTPGCTEASNLIAYSWGQKFLKKGDVILTSEYEHHSSLVPWQAVCEKTQSRIEFLPIEGNLLEFDLETFKRSLHEKVRVLVISGMSNVTGYIPPLKEMIACAHANNAIVVIDAAQLASHCPVDIGDLDPDFFFFSAHKMLGPTGVGALCARKELLNEMNPFLYGGDMILRVEKERSLYQAPPQKFEAGTPNIAGVIGFGAAIDYLNEIGIDAIFLKERELISHLKEALSEHSSIQCYIPRTGDHGSIVSFNVDGVHSHDLGALLDAQGIAVRTGFHCAMPLMERLGVSSTVRASVYFYNTIEEINALVAAIQKAEHIFRK